MILANTMSLNEHIGQDICLQCRLSQQESLVSQYGKPYFRLKLEDSYGKSYGLVWPNNALYEYLPNLELDQLPTIEVTGRVAQLSHYIYIKVASLSLITPPHVINGAQVLPRMLVPFPAQDAHIWLVNFISSLSSDALRSFMTRALLDPNIGLRYFRARASVNSHHNYQGGLLNHSVEMARLISAMGKELELSPLEIELSQVGALLHDLGKVLVVGESNPRPLPWKLFRHEAQSLFLIAPHLSKLNTDDPMLGWVLTHLLDRLASAKSSIDSHFIGEDLIRHADYLSSASDVGKSLADLVKNVSFDRASSLGWVDQGLAGYAE